jgi:hypothetical protein
MLFPHHNMDLPPESPRTADGVSRLVAPGKNEIDAIRIAAHPAFSRVRVPGGNIEAASSITHLAHCNTSGSIDRTEPGQN